MGGGREGGREGGRNGEWLFEIWGGREGGRGGSLPSLVHLALDVMV